MSTGKYTLSAAEISQNTKQFSLTSKHFTT
jgi:hypothetical protein